MLGLESWLQLGVDVPQGAQPLPVSALLSLPLSLHVFFSLFFPHHLFFLPFFLTAFPFIWDLHTNPLLSAGRTPAECEAVLLSRSLLLWEEETDTQTSKHTLADACAVRPVSREETPSAWVEGRWGGAFELDFERWIRVLTDTNEEKDFSERRKKYYSRKEVRS